MTRVLCRKDPSAPNMRRTHDNPITRSDHLRLPNGTASELLIDGHPDNEEVLGFFASEMKFGANSFACVQQWDGVSANNT